jgi:hypothetical protein
MLSKMRERIQISHLYAHAPRIGASGGL